MNNLTAVMKILIYRQFKNCDDITNNLSKSEIIRLISQETYNSMMTKEFILYLAKLIDDGKISLSDMIFARIDDGFIKMLYKNKSFIYRNFSFFDICTVLDLCISASLDANSKYIKNRMGILADSLITMGKSSGYEMLNTCSDDVVVFVYSKLRHNMAVQMFQYNDSIYWSHGGTEIFNHECVTAAMNYLRAINPKSIISEDILNMDLSYDNWIRIKNEIIPLLYYNMNNVKIIQGIIDIVGFRLPDQDLVNIRESLEQSQIPLEDFTEYGYILSEHDIPSSEVTKDINLFLLRGGNISTINILSNGTIYITYDMLYIFASKFNKNSYKALYNEYVVDELIHMIPILSPVVISNMASYVLSSDVYKYPTKLVDYLISHLNFNINSITSSNYKMLSYILSKSCSIAESIVLRNMILDDPNILDYVPYRSIDRIDMSTLLDALRASTKFHHNINKYLASNYVLIPIDIYNRGYGNHNHNNEIY